MLARTVSHRYADLILGRNFETEWAEVLGAIGELPTPVRDYGASLWSRLRAQLISALTRLAWLPDIPVPSWHQEHRSDRLIHVDLEKHGIALMVADSHRGLYGDLFALNAAGMASQSDVGIYVVATTGLVGTNGSHVATLEDVSLPLTYRFGGMAMPLAIVGIEPFSELSPSHEVPSS